MRLNKEDMHLFGHYPAHDDFYLVVCSACNQVIKPQVFQSHCGHILHPHSCWINRVSTIARTQLEFIPTTSYLHWWYSSESLSIMETPRGGRARCIFSWQGLLSRGQILTQPKNASSRKKFMANS
ncbi:ataxin-7-like protein 1 [Tupaia chinensis]|uniref:ataxin-7-like protein 1 n=1 Tax=Tupaia chinensis TaxID=246437 RepID=UPI000FFC1F90|nr:ataxin-7-like protein 1 [Tupaia chinensis]